MASHPTKVDWTTRNRRPEKGQTPQPPRERSKDMTDGAESYRSAGQGKSAERYGGPGEQVRSLPYHKALATDPDGLPKTDTKEPFRPQHTSESPVDPESWWAVKGHPQGQVDPEEGHD